MTQNPTPELIKKFVAIVGDKNALMDKKDQTHYINETRGIFIGKTPVVLKPANTQEVSDILKLANETQTAIVPQGGHTGHVAGGIPSEAGDQIVVTLERMKEIRDIDLKGNTLTVDAGVVLQNIQMIADENNRLFPLSLGAQGSCMIGGNISTNAGGTGVLAYGNTRAMVLGLEVVLANGDVWNGLRKLKKDNTGYDLRDLFIGAEGSLGIVTGAVLKLFPKPKGKEMAFVGLTSPDAALALLNLAQDKAGSQLTAFELIPERGLGFLLKHFPKYPKPMQSSHDWFVMMEISSGRSTEDARSLCEAVLEQALDKNIIQDGVVATSIAQQNVFWNMREDLSLAQRPEGASIAHDISVPVHLVPELISKGQEAILDIVSDARMVAFGHLGDGNIHFNFSQPKDMSREDYLKFREPVNEIVYALVAELGGSISAEHGIGKLKRDLMAKTKEPVELAMMKSIKATLDPKGIMNPGKVL